MEQSPTPTPIPTPTPTWHIHPAYGWINDPNGLIRWGDRWHVFFQHNPIAPVHDRIHWGHVSSDDLLRWDEHPVAFGPTPDGPDRFGCWSGVFVADHDHPAVVYSGVIDASADSTVCLRSADPDDAGLDRWSEPVVVAHTPRIDGIEVMRDPFLFEHGGTRWAILGAGLTGGVPAVLLFSCNDIHEWTYAGILLTGNDPIADQLPVADIWECPQLVVIDGVAVLVLSLQLHSVLGPVVALSGVLSDGSSDEPSGEPGPPQFQASAWTALDVGDGFYAPQAVPDPDGGAPLLFGWVRPNDEYADAADGVAGCLTLPRRLAVRTGDPNGAQVLAERDPVTDALLGAATHAQAEQVELPCAAMVQVVSSAPGPIALTGRHRQIETPSEPGTEIWVDGEVVEIFTPGRPSATYRDAGTSTWIAQVPTDAVVEVRPLRSAPG